MGRKAASAPEQDWLIVRCRTCRSCRMRCGGRAGALENNRQFYLRATNGQLHGRPVNGKESPYLFTGFTACQHCGGSLYVRARSLWQPAHVSLRLPTHYHVGPKRCPEPMLMPMAAVDAAILAQIEQDVLHPAIIVKAIEKALRATACARRATGCPARGVQKELRHLEAELARLTTAIASRWHACRHCSRRSKSGRLGARSSTPNWPCSTASRSPRSTRSALKKSCAATSRTGQDWLGGIRPRRRQILRKLLQEKHRDPASGTKAVDAIASRGRPLLGCLFEGVVLGKYPGVPNGIRTRVAGLKGRRPRPG